MAWDFSTEPEFQKKLDWVDQFCKNEIEPLSYVFPYAIRARHPKVRALVKNLQDQIKAQGLWAIFLDKELGGPGYGQARPTPATWRCLRRSAPTRRRSAGSSRCSSSGCGRRTR
jgi:alkylation response protein AidB-like acyl-CoA dehydrogenase